MHRYEKSNADIASLGRPERAERGSESAVSALFRHMNDIVPWGQSPIDNRAEPTDDRPQLVAHDVSSVADGPLTAFYDPEGGATDGQIIYARATIDVEDWL